MCHLYISKGVTDSEQGWDTLVVVMMNKENDEIWADEKRSWLLVS